MGKRAFRSAIFCRHGLNGKGAVPISFGQVSSRLGVVGTMALADGNGKWILGGGVLVAAVVGGWLMFGGAGEGEIAEEDEETSASEAVPAAGTDAEDGDTEDDAEDEDEASEEPASN